MGAYGARGIQRDGRPTLKAHARRVAEAVSRGDFVRARELLNELLRQWVLSLPRRVRLLAARHPALASRLLDVFTRAAFTSAGR
jgi:hypothetical protein